MFVNIHKTYRDVVAICDEDLIGKKFEQEEFQLDVKESFFKGEQVSEEKLVSIVKAHLKEDATFNIIGEKSINVLLSEGLISEDAVKKIDNVPFALVLM